MSALEQRYVSDDMKQIFSDQNKYRTWRKVWHALAVAQFNVGLSAVTKDHLDIMERTIGDIDFSRVAEIEKITRHDVMAHIQHWSEQQPEISPILHLGATSSFVTDNTEYILLIEAIDIITDRVVELIRSLIGSKANSDLEVLGYTHFQPAQPVTMNKRVAGWAQDLVQDFVNLGRLKTSLPCRGVQGTTGTADSYLVLLGSEKRVRDLQFYFVDAIKGESFAEITGQTLSRKWDIEIGNVLVSIAASLAKFGNDIRLLSHTGDCYGEFQKDQVGSSAMPYKRNPMKAERICALSRLIPGYHSVLIQTAMTQWLERSLDDSAARRVALVDIFYALDATLITAIDLVNHLVVQKTGKIEEYKDYLIAERLIARAVSMGMDRQEIHHTLMQAYRLPINEAMDMLNNKYPFLREIAVTDSLSGLSASKARNYLEKIELQLRPYKIKSVAKRLEV